MPDTDRDSILDAVYVLNDIRDCLVAGTMVFDRYQREFESRKQSKGSIVAVQKLCISHLILGLCRLLEFWKHYHRLVPSELKSEVKAAVFKLPEKDLQEYRNTVVAHIWDTQRGRAKTQLEAFELLNRISGNSPTAFLLWLNNPNDHVYPKTLLSIVDALRDRLREEHSVSAEEVFNR